MVAVWGQFAQPSEFIEGGGAVYSRGAPHAALRSHGSRMGAWSAISGKAVGVALFCLVPHCTLKPDLHKLPNECFAILVLRPDLIRPGCWFLIYIKRLMLVPAPGSVPGSLFLIYIRVSRST